MRLVLSRLEERDLDAIVPALFEAFKTNDICTVFFGHKSPASYAHCKRSLRDGLLKDPADGLLKIEELDAQVDVNVLDERCNTAAIERRTRIICFSEWKIYPTSVPSKEEQQAANNGHGQDNEETNKTEKEARTESALSYLEDEQERADAATLIENFLFRRRRQCKEAHVLCFLLFTDEEYHGKGCGRMMMQWGNDVADALMSPCWVEASPEGEPLYHKMGYQEKEKVKVQTKSFFMGYTHMRRLAMVERVRLEGRCS